MHNSNFTIGIFTASAFVGRMSVALSVGGVGNINWGFIRRNTFHSSALRGLNTSGFLPPVLDQRSLSYDAIRGREQQLIDFNGGAQSVGGAARNMINGISDYNLN